ncbi:MULTISPECIES: hypothetical protein [Streptosporangium]|uniref:Transposase n=1 Tax=Streptosporangium brasiliense TaxID=47480 RepID=A0ABT9RKD1_9ACTN|nr:hypothetical protein [Streptosporangium brasiliense]MDP9869194.1 hypothetical protein [Streptosporangium brasiliense]
MLIRPDGRHFVLFRFTDLAQVEDRLRVFEDRYNATAQPFQWKFATSGLDDLPARLDRHGT